MDLEEVDPPSRGSKRQKNSIPEGYVIGEPKVYYTGLDVSLDYLKALLSAEVLLERGLKAIPHGRSPKLYASILRYDFSFQTEDAPLIPDEVLGEELSEDDDGGLEALHDAFMADAGGVEDGEAIDLFFPRNEDDVDEDPGGPAAAAALGPYAFTPPPELPAAPPPEPPPPPPWVADMEEQVPLEVDENKRPVLLPKKWGVFTVTAAPKAGRYGSYQVVCPFHRLNTRTGCKKQCCILGPGKAELVASHFIAPLS